MKYIVSLIFVFFSVIAIEAGHEIKHKGYIYALPSITGQPENASFFMQEGDDIISTNLIRARYMPRLHIGSSSEIALHYEIDLLHTSSALPFFMNYDKTNRQAVDMNWSVVDEEHFKANHFIDMLYYKYMSGPVNVTFGRQVISWGVGRVWQPMDMFNPINPANYTKFERDGADALSVQYFFGFFSDLELVYNFGETWDEGNFGGRFRTNYEEFDLQAMAGFFDNDIIAGASFAGNLFDAGVRGEAVYSFHEHNSDSNYVRFILGADYQFTSKLYAMLEYQYNGEGTCNEKEYINYLLRLSRGEIQNLGKQYVAAQVNYQVHPLVNLSGMSISNIGDGSGYIGMTAQYNAFQNVNISLGGMLVYGPKLSEYRYYSPAAYLVGEFYY